MISQSLAPLAGQRFTWEEASSKIDLDIHEPKKYPHQALWSINMLAAGPPMIQVQPRIRPPRSTQLRSGCRWPMRTSVSHDHLSDEVMNVFSG
jgi:hypothetical protein